MVSDLWSQKIPKIISKLKLPLKCLCHMVRDFNLRDKLDLIR